jgi:hypothetical protein
VGAEQLRTLKDGRTMGPSESDRLRLFETARRSWGDEAAATLMDLLPPLDWSQVATKQDLAELRSDLRAEIADLRGELHREIGSVRAEIAGLRADLTGEITGVRAELKSDIADLRSEVHLRFAEHTRTIVLAVVGSNVALVGLTYAAARFA